MNKEIVKYITQIRKMVKDRTLQDRVFHSLHMELEDSIVVKNVRKNSDTNITFIYHDDAGSLSIEGFNIIVNFRNISKIVDSYNEIVTVLCQK